MEDLEKKFIQRNLHTLSIETKCNDLLLAALKSEDILSTQECKDLETQRITYGTTSQSHMFYNILLEKPNSYNVLLKALQSSRQNQSEAARILARGKAHNFKQNINDDRNTQIRFVSPPQGFREKFLNRRIPILAISTQDVTISIQRLQQESIPLQLHIFSTKEALIYETENMVEYNILLVAIYNKNIGAVVDVIHILKEISSENRQSIVVTTFSKNIVQELLVICHCIEDNFKWSDLSNSFQKELLGKPIIFQGHEMTLGSLLNCCSESEAESTELLNKLENIFLLQLIKDEKPECCRNTLERLSTPAYYIYRKVISRGKSISGEILNLENSSSHTSFVITGMSRTKLLMLTGSNSSDVQTCEDQLSSRKPGICAKFIILLKHKNFELLCRRILPEHTVQNLHWLNSSDKNSNQLEWMRSFGGESHMSLVQKYVIPPSAEFQNAHSVSEKVFASNMIQAGNDLKIPAVCISDKPGMGKSTLIAHMGKEILKHAQSELFNNSKLKFVQYFAITELMRDLEQMGIKNENQLRKEDILEILLCKITNTDFVRHIFTSMSVNCELLLDGFDEVLPHQAKLAAKLVATLRYQTNQKLEPKFRLWVTTRPVLLPVIEQALGVIGYNMLPFGTEDQTSFLIMYWQQAADTKGIPLNPKKLETFALACLQKMEKVNGKLSPFEIDMTGIPLQCLLLAQVCEGSVNYECSDLDQRQNVKFQDIESLSIKNMADLYRQVMDKKLELFLNRESSDSHLGSHLSQNTKQVMKRIHMRLALELLFPNWAKQFEIVFLHEALVTTEEFSIYGIVTEYEQNCPVFLHRTYAEYFVALFVFEIGTNQRLLKGFGITSQMAEFCLTEIMATRQEFSRSDVNLPEFKMQVVTYFLDELLQMAQQKIPKCLLQAIHENLEEIQPNHKFKMETSRVLACVTNDRTNLAHLLISSMTPYSIQNWLSNSEKQHPTLMYATALRGSKKGLAIICTLLKQWNNQNISELSYEPIKNPMLAAVLVGNRGIVEYLLLEKEFGAQVWAQPELRILHTCVARTSEDSARIIDRRKDIIRLLVESDASILEHLDKFDRTPLLAEDVHIQLRMELVKLGANVNAYWDAGQVLHMLGDFHGVSPEAYHEFLETLEHALLDSDSDPDEQGWLFSSTGGRTPDGHITTPNWIWGRDTALHLAVGHLEVSSKTLALFHKHDFEWDEENDEGYTVLHVAVKYKRSMKLIKALIEDYNADWTVQNNAGMTVFHEAAAGEHVDFLNWICENHKDFDINVQDHHQRTALHYAMMAPENRLEIVGSLLKYGADGNVQNFEEETPLTYSLRQGNAISVDFLKQLKRGGLNILGVDENDKHGVIRALYRGADEVVGNDNLRKVVEYLVSEGADLLGKNGRGNLLHFAADRGWLNGIKLLRKHLSREALEGLSLAKDKDGCTPIYKAIWKRKLHILRWFLDTFGKGILEQECGEGGMLPVHACGKVAWLEGMELLVDKYKFEIWSRDELGNTPLHHLLLGEEITTDLKKYLNEKLKDLENVPRNEKGETPEEYRDRVLEESGALNRELWN